MRLRKRFAWLAFAVSLGLAAPAAAQVALGSPNARPALALGAGAFNFIPDAAKPDDRTAAELRAEYRFGDVWWILSPFIGVSGASDGAFYGYFGFGFDVDLGSRWVLFPNAAAGYFARGGGIDLGSWWEFRTGAELDYRFSDLTRLGVAFHHMSNAGLTRQNPGEESLTLVYTVPLR